jgi:surface antigen
MTVAAVAFAAGLSGCASLGLPFGPDNASPSPETTAAIASGTSAADSVAASDWDTVRKTIAALPAGQVKPVQWTNPATGSTGTVVAAERPAGKANCRPFSTTVSDARGVRRYRGQACHSTDGSWQLVALAADDSLLS